MTQLQIYAYDGVSLALGDGDATALDDVLDIHMGGQRPVHTLTHTEHGVAVDFLARSHGGPFRALRTLLERNSTILVRVTP